MCTRSSHTEDKHNDARVSVGVGMLALVSVSSGGDVCAWTCMYGGVYMQASMHVSAVEMYEGCVRIRT